MLDDDDDDLDFRYIFPFLPDRLKIYELCTKATNVAYECLNYVPNWFTSDDIEKIAVHHIQNCNSYPFCIKKLMNVSKNTKIVRVLKSKIYKELFPIAWHPSR